MTGTSDTNNQNTPSIWERTLGLTKTTMEIGFAIALVGIAATTIYAAAKGVALPLAFLANPWVIAAIVSCLALYLAMQAISSFNQRHAVEGAQGAPGKNASFAALVDGVLKSGTIVEETVKTEESKEGVKQLSLKLSAADYTTLTNGKNVGDEVTLNVLLAGKSVEVKFKHVAAANDNGNYKVTLTSPTDKKDLDMVDNSNSLEVMVSDKALKALEASVPTKLVRVSIDEAMSQAKAAA